MNGNSLGDVGVAPGALAAAERSEGERREPQRSAAAAKAGADVLLASRSDPEVVAKPKRRTYTASTNSASWPRPRWLPPYPEAWARFSGAKVCTRLCWPIGGANGPTASAKR